MMCDLTIVLTPRGNVAVTMSDADTTPDAIPFDRAASVLLDMLDGDDVVDRESERGRAVFAAYMLFTSFEHSDVLEGTYKPSGE